MNRGVFLVSPQNKAANLVSGFTLVELMMTVAIIAILSSIVYAGLGSSRAKARDAKRVTDIKQIQIALAVYFNVNRAYPADIYAETGSLKPTYMSVVPRDPVGSDPDNKYKYAGLGSSSCASYHLGTTLEIAGNFILNEAVHSPASSSVCAGSGADFDGSADPTKTYDVAP